MKYIKNFMKLHENFYTFLKLCKFISEFKIFFLNHLKFFIYPQKCRTILPRKFIDSQLKFTLLNNSKYLNGQETSHVYIKRKTFS